MFKGRLYLINFVILISFVSCSANNFISEVDFSLSNAKCNFCKNEFTDLITQSKVLKRKKRYLGFVKGTRVFFRLNMKDNVIRINQIWAHAFGFRINYDINYPVPKFIHTFKKRDVHNTIEELINQYGFDGRACVLRAFCEASKTVTPESGMFFKLFKLIFSNKKPYDTFDDKMNSINNNNRLPEGDEKSKPYLTSNNCDELDAHCPLSLLHLSPYTDDI